MTTFTTHYDQRFAHIPQRVLVDEMDRARRLVEDTQRVHDTLAYELGFDRVRVEDIGPGDRIRSNEGGTFYEVHHVDTWVEKGGFDSHLRVWFVGHDTVERYEPGQMVSRKRDESTEPF